MPYKERLSSLRILPLMHRLKVYDILFFISSLSSPQAHLNIFDFVTFSVSKTIFGSQFKLKHRLSASNLQRHSYLHRLPRLWNSLPTIDPNSSFSVIKAIVTSLISTPTLTQQILAHITICVHATHASQPHQLSLNLPLTDLFLS